MSIDFTRQSPGVYSGIRGRFSIYRKDGQYVGKPIWLAYDAKQVGGVLSDDGLVGTYATLAEAQTALSRIWNAERREIARQQADERRAAREAKEAAEAAERVARQTTEGSAYNHDVYLDLRITKKEAIEFISRLANHAADSDEVQIVIRTSHASTCVAKEGGGTQWVAERRVDLIPGWSGFDTAHATIVDSGVAPCEPFPVGEYAVA